MTGENPKNKFTEFMKLTGENPENKFTEQE